MPIETNPLDVAGISQRYRYDPSTGEIISLYYNRVVGRRTNMGYVVVDVPNGEGDRVTVMVHRMAYVLVTGEDIPVGKYIDHINRVRSDNRWENLRLCSHQQNLLNSSRERENGLPAGVYENKGSGVKPFKAKIKVAGKSKYLGSYATAEQAKAVFDAAWSEAYDDPKT